MHQPEPLLGFLCGGQEIITHALYTAGIDGNQSGQFRLLRIGGRSAQSNDAILG